MNELGVFLPQREPFPIDFKAFNLSEAPIWYVRCPEVHLAFFDHLPICYFICIVYQMFVHNSAMLSRWWALWQSMTYSAHIPHLSLLHSFRKKKIVRVVYCWWVYTPSISTVSFFPVPCVFPSSFLSILPWRYTPIRVLLTNPSPTGPKKTYCFSGRVQVNVL